LALESSHQGRIESEILLVCISTEGIQRVERSPLHGTGARVTRFTIPQADAIYDTMGKFHGSMNNMDG